MEEIVRLKERYQAATRNHDGEELAAVVAALVGVLPSLNEEDMEAAKKILNINKDRWE